MNEQLSFLEICRPSEQVDSLFLAGFPAPDALTQIITATQRLCSKHGLRGKVRPDEILHLTFNHIGEYHGVPEHLVREINEACKAVSATMSPFEVTFDQVGSYAGKHGRHPCVLQDSGQNTSLLEFHRCLGKALRERGIRWKDSFNPHITLLYDRVNVPKELLDTPITWTFNELVLIDSLVGETRYIPLAKWALNG